MANIQEKVYKKFFLKNNFSEFENVSYVIILESIQKKKNLKQAIFQYPSKLEYKIIIEPKIKNLNSKIANKNQQLTNGFKINF